MDDREQKEKDLLHLEVGRFVGEFAAAEASMFSVFALVSRLNYVQTMAIIGGMRLVDVLNIIPRLLELSKLSQESKTEISTLIEQLQKISALRTVIVHHGLSMAYGKISAMNLFTAKKLESFQIWSTDLENLRAATADLRRIGWRAIRLTHDDEQAHFSHESLEALFSPWLYKPVQQDTPLKPPQSKRQKQ